MSGGTGLDAHSYSQPQHTSQERSWKMRELLLFCPMYFSFVLE